MNAGLMTRTWADFRLYWRQPLAFHLLMQLLGFAIFAPLLTWVGRRIVLASGEPVISNFDIATFVLSPSGALFVLVVAAFTVSLLLAEFAGLSWIAGHAIARQSVTLASTIALVLRKLPSLILAVHARVPAPRAAGPALPGSGRSHLVHDARRARHQLLPRGTSARVATRETARRHPGRRLWADRRLAARTLAVRRADPGLRRRQSPAGPGEQRPHDARQARADRDATGAVVAAAHRGDRGDHVGVPRDLGRRAQLGGHRRPPRSAARCAVPRRDTRRCVPLRRPASHRPGVPGHSHVRGATRSDKMAYAGDTRDQRRALAVHCTARRACHSGSTCVGVRWSVARGLEAQPGNGRRDHRPSWRLDRSTREHARRIPHGDGGRRELQRA